MPQVMTEKEALPVGVKTRTTCRSCNSGHLLDVLDLGNPFVSTFTDVPDAADWPRVPLELVLCADCTLLQLRHTTPTNWLYRRYWHKCGANATIRAELADVAAKASAVVGLTHGDRILDIGSNDGTLLRSYKTKGILRVGFEPSETLATKAAEGADQIINNFFDADLLENETFRIITSIGMFYEVEDPNAFAADVARLLARGGVWVIEMPYLPLTLARNAVDAFCHKSLEYYCLRSLESLLARHGLEVIDFEMREIEGGIFRVYAVHRVAFAAGDFDRGGRVESGRSAERWLSLDQASTYHQFAARIHHVGKHLAEFLEKERGRGKQISVYGASTKGNTLLQVFGLDHNRIHSAAVRNPEKWAKYTIGTWIPIVSEAEARARADYLLLLPWHLAGEVRDREREFLERGGKLIAPLPDPRLIDRTGMHRLL